MVSIAEVSNAVVDEVSVDCRCWGIRAGLQGSLFYICYCDQQQEANPWLHHCLYFIYLIYFTLIFGIMINACISQYYKNILSTTLLQLIIYYLEINFEVWQKLDNDLKWPNDSKIQKIYDIMRYQAKLEIHTIFLSCYYTHQYTLHSTYLLSWTTYSI